MKCVYEKVLEEKSLKAKIPMIHLTKIIVGFFNAPDSILLFSFVNHKKSEFFQSHNRKLAKENLVYISCVWLLGCHDIKRHTSHKS